MLQYKYIWLALYSGGCIIFQTRVPTPKESGLMKRVCQPFFDKIVIKNCMKLNKWDREAARVPKAPPPPPAIHQCFNIISKVRSMADELPKLQITVTHRETMMNISSKNFLFGNAHKIKPTRYINIQLIPQNTIINVISFQPPNICHNKNAFQ